MSFVIKKYFIFSIVFFIAICASAQKQKKLEKKASKLFENEQYSVALPLYLSLHEKYPLNTKYNFYTGLCYLYSSSNNDKAISYFESAIKDSVSYEEYIYSHYYLAQVYHYANRFDDAIKLLEKYKSFIYTEDREGIELLKLVNRKIDMCNNGKELVEHPVEVVMTNMGNGINSIYNEYSPVISSNESVIVFTSKRPNNVGGKVDENGEFYEDIFLSKNINGKWSKPINIDSSSFLKNTNTNTNTNTKSSLIYIKNSKEAINTKNHDAAIGLSPDGTKLFIYRLGKIYMSTLNDEAWSKPMLLNSNINSKRSRQPSITITSDGNTLYFSSDRKGGYGGLDIYKSELTAMGDWGPAVNMGDSINTEYDDDAVFVHPDGKTLFFSSKGHNTMGGYDIFKSFYKDDNWCKPKNLGYPINTPGDDIFYVENSKGNHAYFASMRTGGYGYMDIYLLLFPGVSIPIAGISGKIFEENSLLPISATIIATNKITAKVDTFKSNPVNGEYMLYLPPDQNYDLTINASGFQSYKFEIYIPDQKIYYPLYQEVMLSKLKVRSANIGQKVVIKNAFFNIDNIINSDSELSLKLNKALDSISNIDTLLSIIKDSIAPIKPRSEESVLNKNDFYAQYINNVKKVKVFDSNNYTTFALKTNSLDTVYFKETNSVKYSFDPDSLAKNFNIPVNTIKNILSRPFADVLVLLSMTPNSLNTFLTLSEKDANAILHPYDYDYAKKDRYIINNSLTTNNTKTITSNIKTTLPYEALNRPVSELKGFFYSIQIGVFSKKINTSMVFNITPIFDEFTEKGKYRYNTGVYSTLQDAVIAKNAIINSGVKDAFIVSYNNGQKISLSEANKILLSGKAKLETPSPSIIKN